MPARKKISKKKAKKAVSATVKKKAAKPKAKKTSVKKANTKATNKASNIKDSGADFDVENSSKKKPEPAISPLSKAFIVGLFALAIIVLIYQFNNEAETKGIEQKCLEIQNDPMLKYPCVCKPTATPDEDDIVYSKSTSMCTCECEIEGVGTKVFEIRASK